MYDRKPPFKKQIKKGDLNKEVIESIEETKRKLKEKIPQQPPKRKQKEE